MAIGAGGRHCRESYQALVQILHWFVQVDSLVQLHAVVIHKMSACLSPDLLDFSSARMSIFQLANVLGAKFLDTYIGLTANLQVS